MFRKLHRKRPILLPKNSSLEVVGTIKHDIEGLPDPQRMGVFTWTIEQFSKHSKDEERLRSPSFEKGGFKGYLVFYPGGYSADATDGYMSAFLNIDKSDDFFEIRKYPTCRYMFTLKNQDKQVDINSSSISNDFDVKSSWGTRRFAKIERLNDPNYLVEDVLKFEVKLDVQAPDGQLAAVAATGPTEAAEADSKDSIEHQDKTDPSGLSDAQNSKKPPQTVDAKDSASDSSSPSSDSDGSVAAQRRQTTMPAHLMKSINDLATGKTFAKKYIMSDEFVSGKPHIRFAEHAVSGDSVILKFFSSREIFVNVCQVHKRLAKTQIVCKLLDVVDDTDNFPPCAVFERARHTLDEWINKKNPNPLERRGILLEILNAIHGLHNNCLVHTDLKPQNIMMFGNYEWKLADLDSVVVPGEPAEILATVTYAAPEIIRAGREHRTDLVISTAADMWAFGIIVFEILSGKRFFGEGVDPGIVEDRLLSEDFMPELDCVGDKCAKRFIEKLLRPEPENRMSAARAIKSSFFKLVETTTTRFYGD